MALSTVYQIMGVIVPLITAPYISRILGADGVGINSYTASILSYFTLFAALGIQSYGNREVAYHQNNIKERSKIFWELQILQTISTGIMIVLFIIFLLFQSKYKFYFLLQGISLLTVVANISWFFMGLENFKIIVYRNTIINILMIILTFVLVRNSSDLWIYILLVTGANLFANISVWPFLKREICKVSIKELNVKRHFVATLALLLPQIVTVAYSSINKTMLGWLGNVVGAGYFYQANMIIVAVFAAVSSFAAAFLPRLSNLFSENKITEGKNLILDSFQMMYALSFLAIAGIYGVSGNFAIFYFGPKFSVVGPLMVIQAWIILLFGISVVIRSQYLMAIRRMKEITIASIIALVVNILFNIVLIPEFGAIGASIAVVITELMSTLYLIWSIRNDFKYRDVFRGIWKYVLAGVVTFLVIFNINMRNSMSIYNYIFETIAGILVYGICMVILRAPIVDIIMRFKKGRK